MKAKLSTRLGLWVGVPATLLFTGVLYFSSQRSVRRVVEETDAKARATARFYAARVDARLADAARIPVLHGQVLESGILRTKADLEKYLHDVVDRSPEIYGSCLAFKPA